MMEATLAPTPAKAPGRLPWIWGVLSRPGSTLEQIVHQSRQVWLTPLLILSLAALVQVAASGWLRQMAAATGDLQLPPDFQFYSPEQQAQVMQALQATSGPVFLFVFPGMLALARIWVGWLLVGSLVHLALTMLGGRGATLSTMNLVAWASLPLAIRDLVRVAAMLSTRELIAHPGLSGFAPPGGEGWPLFVSQLLVAVDLYLIWHAVLLVVGARAGGEITTAKGVLGAFIPLLLALTLRALLGYGMAYLSTLTIGRPYFF